MQHNRALISVAHEEIAGDTTDTIYLRAMERPENNDSQVGKSSLSSQD